MENIDFEKIFSFIADILNAKPEENTYIKKFDSLVKNDFSVFCDSVRDLNQMKDARDFDEIKEQMRLIANCPPLHSKMVGAVGGGFSSGKSSFINSFMSGGVKLAEGIRPVTAIPSYVISGESPSINGLSYRGGNFEIKEELYKAISHEMLKKLKFDLKHILSYITVETNLDSSLFSNICLIDTPGYSAPDSGSTEQDMKIAKSYIKDAKFLIWIVGLDSKGTINTSDLDFLDDDDLPFGKEEGKSLYVVANKAGTVTPSNHQNILDTFRDVLEDYGFDYAGISLYDSKQRKEYLYNKMNIRGFLSMQNVSTKKYVDLALPLKGIFDRYESHIREKNRRDKEYQSKVQKLILDGMTSNAISLTSGAKSKLEDGLYELKKYFKPEDLDSSLKKIGELRKKFFECLDSFCEEMGIEKQELPESKILSEATGEETASSAIVKTVRYCTKCGNKIKAGDRFCQNCGVPISIKAYLPDRLSKN